MSIKVIVYILASATSVLLTAALEWWWTTLRTGMNMLFDLAFILAILGSIVLAFLTYFWAVQEFTENQVIHEWFD